MHCTRAPRHLRALALALFTLVLEEMERAVPALLLLPSVASQKTCLAA